MRWFKQFKGTKDRKENPSSEDRQPKWREDAAPPVLTLLRQPPTDYARVRMLSPREREVFDALLAGKKQREIAEMLDVKPTTVSFHCTALYKKLDIHDKAHLFLRYARFGADATGYRGEQP